MGIFDAAAVGVAYFTRRNPVIMREHPHASQVLEAFRVKLSISDHKLVIASRSETIFRSEGRLLGL